MKSQATKRFNPDLGVNSKTPEEPSFHFSWWSVIGFIIALVVFSLVMPTPEVRALPKTTVEYQRDFHDKACDDLHRQTHRLNQDVKRYEQATDATHKLQLWSEVVSTNEQRNATIQMYRDILLRQAVGGNTPVFDVDKVCRFGAIRLEPVSLVARH